VAQRWWIRLGRWGTGSGRRRIRWGRRRRRRRTLNRLDRGAVSHGRFRNGRFLLRGRLHLRGGLRRFCRLFGKGPAVERFVWLSLLDDLALMGFYLQLTARAQVDQCLRTGLSRRALLQFDLALAVEIYLENASPACPVLIHPRDAALHMSL